jgi:putative NADH-flavin reductase
MKIAVIGATGFVGKSITNELLDRNHEVIGISRNPGNTPENNQLTWKAIDITNTDALKDALQGCDVVVSAFNAGWSNPSIYDDFIKGSNAIQHAVKAAGISRYIVIGGAGSLYVAEGLQAVDTPSFPAEIKPGARAARDYYTSLQNEKELDWVFFSPAFEMHPGVKIGRTGKYRLGKDFPVTDENGKSVLSVEDLAVVIADEIEQPKHHQTRFTAAY